ncbi:MAG: transposase [bacterium]
MSDWPHSPIHRLNDTGAYIITSATYQKVKYFNDPERLQFLLDHLFEIAEEYHWQLQAWAVLSNHYHFVTLTTAESKSLSTGISKLHTITAKWLNKLDEKSERKVWYQYWDSHITHQKSYLARLKYVHYNPQHHGVVKNAEEYPWCSARWFARNADDSFRRIVDSFKTDRLTVQDDF